MNRRQKLVQKQFLNNEKTVIDRLQYIYDGALSDIEKEIRNLEFKIDDLTEEYDWLDDGDPKKEIIRSKIQSKIYQKQYQQSLQDQLDGILKQMQTKQFLTVSDYLDTCYEDGFVGSLFDLHGQDVPLLMPIDQEAMVRAVQLDSKISQGLYTRLGEDVNLLKKKITSEVSRSIATGVSFERCAQRLAGQTKIGYNKAVRIARTEGHRIQCSAADDAAHQAKDRGADIVKKWDATLDGATRESHIAVDGEIRELDEPFSNGLMFPGDPAGGAAEVVNCRCAYLQKARRWLEGSFTKWNNFTDQLETFDSPEAYNEFKKSFFSDENRKYMNYVEQMQDKYGTKDFRKVLDQMTDREYKHYSKLLANNPVYNVKAPVKPKAVKLTQDMFPSSFTATKAEAKNTQAIMDFVNGCEDADANVVELYSKMAKMENIESQGIPFKVRHIKSSHVNYHYRVSNGHLTDAEISYPKLTLDNPIGQLNTTLHEQMHLLDMYCRLDPKKAKGWYSPSQTDLKQFFDAVRISGDVKMSPKVKKLFSDFADEYNRITNEIAASKRKLLVELRDQYRAGTITYTDYKKQYKKIENQHDERYSWETRNALGGGIDCLQDIYDALSGGRFRDRGTVMYGHGGRYYTSIDDRCSETLANYGALSITRPELIDLLREDYPELVDMLDETVKGMLKKVGE